MRIYRQGDLIIKEVAAVPKSARLVKKSTAKTPYILAEGEATGHAHRLAGGEVFVGLSKRFLNLTKEGVLTHEEHGNIAVAPGTYEVEREQEFDHLGQRAYDVAD